MHSDRKQVFESIIPVRWGDMDAYGHVNNTLYFRYVEENRVQWLESQGFRVNPNQPTSPVIINASFTFLIPVNYPATLTIKLYAGKPGRSSVMTWYEVWVQGDDRLHAEGHSKIVWMNNETGKSAPLPERFRAFLDHA
jgi:acyl-CoA thioester hydrolase